MWMRGFSKLFTKYLPQLIMVSQDLYLITDYIEGIAHYLCFPALKFIFGKLPNSKLSLQNSNDP